AVGSGRLHAAGAPALIADAVKSRDTARLAALLKSGDVNAQQPDGTTALHWAAYWDDAATIDALLHAGAHVDTANRYGVTPLFVAATNGNAVTMKRLLAAGANPNTVAGADRAVGEG